MIIINAGDPLSNHVDSVAVGGTAWDMELKPITRLCVNGSDGWVEYLTRTPNGDIMCNDQGEPVRKIDNGTVEVVFK